MTYTEQDLDNMRRTTEQRYPIRAVARITRLSVDTLRAWERRYEAVVPERDHRGRVYSEADITRLKQLALLVERGHAIGTIASLSARDLTSLIDSADALAATGRDQVPAADLIPMLRALDRYDLTTLESALARHAAVLPARELVFAVILPLLRELGARWQAGALSPAQEHLVSAIVRSALGGLLRSIGTSGSPRVIFATPAVERHELCLLCAAVLAAAAGYGALYLGPDLPAADIAHAARASGAITVVLAATTPGVVTRGEAKQLARHLSGVDLWIGGPQAAALLRDIGFGQRVDTLEELLTLLARVPRAGA